MFARERIVLSQSTRMQSTTTSNDEKVSIVYKHGLPVITLSLPSKHEKCSFTLKPLLSTVGQFLDDIKSEDKGIDTAVIHRPDGVRVSSSTKIEHLLLENFQISLNNVSYDVHPPQEMGDISSEHVLMYDDVKQMIARLYNDLNVDQHCVQREEECLSKLEDLRSQLEPLEKMKNELDAKAGFRTNLVIWGGLAYMAVQFGILARLTWWEYSWDIMEPVTYFITYATAMVMYGYFILTNQEYLYPDARDRQYLRFFHRAASKSKFDISKYNRLSDEITQAESDLHVARKPLKSLLPKSSAVDRQEDLEP